MMLNSFGKNQEKDVFTILKIKHWVQNYFELRGYENVLVTELKCHEERYSPVKTVIVILKEGTEKTEASIIDHCKVHLASFKAPTKVIFQKYLPKNPSGKLLKRELREQHATEAS